MKCWHQPSRSSPGGILEAPLLDSSELVLAGDRGYLDPVLLEFLNRDVPFKFEPNCVTSPEVLRQAKSVNLSIGYQLFQLVTHPNNKQPFYI